MCAGTARRRRGAGPGRDGGWWVLGVTDAAMADCLRAVPMSRPDTGAVTLAALARHRYNVGLVRTLADVDTVDDVDAVRRACAPDSRFARATREVGHAGEPLRPRPGRRTLLDPPRRRPRGTAAGAQLARRPQRRQAVRPCRGRAVRRSDDRLGLRPRAFGGPPGRARCACAGGRPVRHRRRTGAPQRRAGPAPRRVRTAARDRAVAYRAAGRRQRRARRGPVAGAAAGGRAASTAAAGAWPNSTRRSTESTRAGCGWSRRARSARGSGGRRSASTARRGWPTTSAWRSRRSTRSAAAWWPAWRRHEDRHAARHGRHRPRRPLRSASRWRCVSSPG